MILERIETAARLFPSRTAFDDGKPLSYGELWQSALRRADAIRSLAASADAPAALCAGKRETLISMLACLIAGVPYVPLSPDTPAARTLLSARKAGARLLVTDGPARFSEREGAEPFQASDPECLSLPDGLSVLTPEALDEHARGDFRPVGIDGSRTAYIIFTSGSTGEPKGVPIARASLENFVGWLDGLEGLSGADGADIVQHVAPGVVLPSCDDIVACVGIPPDCALDVGQRVICLPQRVVGIDVFTKSHWQKLYQKLARHGVLMAKLDRRLTTNENMFVSIKVQLEKQICDL